MLKGKHLLTPIQEAFLSVFVQMPDQSRFYLTGGTALAEFYLGHRLSFDLDFFTSEEGLILPLSHSVEATVASHGFEISVVRRFATFVEFLLKKGKETLRVDLALDSPFRFAPPDISEYGVLVNSSQDLKVDKVLAYYGRVEPRDAVDLYFILRDAPLDPLLATAKRKDPGFDLYWFAVALDEASDFPDVLEQWPVKMLVSFDPVHLKRIFREMALDLMSRVTR